MSDRDARIKDEAYRIWVEAGRPDGDSERYWFEAEKRVEVSDEAGEIALKSKKFPRPAADASPEQTPDSGAAKAVGAGQKAAAKPRKGEVEGATSAPAPGPAGAANTSKAKTVARNDGNSGGASPAVARSKGERVEVARTKTPTSASRSSSSKSK